MGMLSEQRSDIEDRIYELLGEGKITPEIVEDIGLPYDEAVELIGKVIKERSTPNLVAVDEALDRLSKIRF